MPGTRMVSRLEEDVAADSVVLTPEQVQRLTNVPPAVGGHHTDEQMTTIER